MLVNLGINPHHRFPRHLINAQWRDTAAVLLVDRGRQAVALQHHMKAAPNDFTVPQGGIQLPREQPFRTCRREVREELQVGRPHPHAATVTDWRHCCYLGSFMNGQARSGVPKRIHFFAAPLMQPVKLRPNGVECDQATWVFGSDQLAWHLRVTGRQNPAKAAAIMTAVYHLHQAGWL